MVVKTPPAKTLPSGLHRDTLIVLLAFGRMNQPIQ
jgi:hypothetical protein